MVELAGRPACECAYEWADVGGLASEPAGECGRKIGTRWTRRSAIDDGQTSATIDVDDRQLRAASVAAALEAVLDSCTL